MCEHLAVRVRRNFAFVDLNGFTALTESEGDERAVHLLTSFRTRVRAICSRRGVRIAKWLGDGAMLVGVEAAPLLGAALEIRHATADRSSPISIRVGASAGEVILLEGDDYIGHPVNLAARLCDLAPPDAVLVTPALVASLPRWGIELRREEIVVRGLERAQEVVHVGLGPVDHGVPDPVCGIPLTREVAEEVARDPVGEPVWFCSDSCRDTWERRPRPVAESQGSPRTPLIGT